MAEVLPYAELVIVGKAGHLVLLEKPESVSDGLVRLVKHASPGRFTVLSQRLRDRVMRRG